MMKTFVTLLYVLVLSFHMFSNVFNPLICRCLFGFRWPCKSRSSLNVGTMMLQANCWLQKWAGFMPMMNVHFTCILKFL